MNTRYAYIHLVRSGNSFGTVTLSYTVEDNIIRYSHAFCVEASGRGDSLKRVDFFSKRIARLIAGGRLANGDIDGEIPRGTENLFAESVIKHFLATHPRYRRYKTHEDLAADTRWRRADVGFLSIGRANYLHEQALVVNAMPTADVLTVAVV